MVRNSVSGRVLFLAIMGLTACGEGAPPVATLTVESAPSELAFPGHETVVLRWEVEPELATDVVGSDVFVHLFDERGNLFRTFDHPFPGSWSPGAVVQDEVELYQSALGPPLAAGLYQLTAGILDRNGQRLPLTTDGEHRGRYEYTLAPVEVPPAVPFVELEFEGDWEPVEVGSDRQILGRRWFGRHGQIVIRGCESGDRARLWVNVPSPFGPRSEFALDEGATVPEVEISTSGASQAIVISGSGQHRRHTLLEPEAGGGCRLSVTSNFVAGYSPEDGMDRVASFEMIAVRRD